MAGAARSYRLAMWAFAALAAAGFALAAAGARGTVASGTGSAGFLLALAALACAAWAGLKVRGVMLAEREADAAHGMRILLAAQLKDHDEATLHEIVRKGGPAAEAARLVLQGRAERRRPTA